MDPKEMVRTGYDSIAAGYLRLRQETTNVEEDEGLKDFISLLPEKGRVLDAGCGAGVPIAHFLSERFNVTGIDISEEQVRLARGLVPKGAFMIQDMTALEFPDGYFDGVCCYYAIIHVPRAEHRKVLDGFNRVLRIGGLLLIVMGAGDLPGGTESDYCGATMYWSHYDAETNIAMLQQSGFKTIRSEVVVDPTDPTARHLYVLARKHKVGV